MKEKFTNAQLAVFKSLNVDNLYYFIISGNCFLHAASDQLLYDKKLSTMSWTASKIRSQVIANTDLLIAEAELDWQGEQSIEDWKLLN